MDQTAFYESLVNGTNAVLLKTIQVSVILEYTEHEEHKRSQANFQPTSIWLTTYSKFSNQLFDKDGSN